MTKGYKCTPELVNKIVELLSSDTYTTTEICRIVGISRTSFIAWRRDDPEFAEALKQAEEARFERFTVEAKKSLMKKIQGYTVQEVTTVMAETKEIDPVTGRPRMRIKEQKTTDKHFQPDTTAIIFALTNRDPANWKNSRQTELTGKGVNVDPSTIEAGVNIDDWIRDYVGINTAAALAAASDKPRRGRPPGSKNAPKTAKRNTTRKQP